MSKEISLQPSPQLVFEEQQGVAVAPSHKQIISLYKKSEQSGIPLDTLLEVYKRGFAASLDEQVAFNRVNSFIAGGAAIMLDNDLIENKSGHPGLWVNINAKRKRIENGSGEHMRKPGSEGAPTAADLKASQTNEGLDPIHHIYFANKHGTYKGSDAVRAKSHEEAHERVSARHKDDKNMGYKITNASTGEVKHFGTHRVEEEYTGAEKVSTNSDDPSSRFIGTDSLTKVLKSQTPGYSNAIKTIKKVVKEMYVRDASGKKVPIEKKKFRGSNMKMQSAYPGKSSSSSGGE